MSVAVAEIGLALGGPGTRRMRPSGIIEAASHYQPNISAKKVNFDLLPVAAALMVQDVRRVITDEGKRKGSFPIWMHKSNPGSQAGRYHLLGDTRERPSYYEVFLTPMFPEFNGQIIPIADGERVILDRTFPNGYKHRLEVVSPDTESNRLAEVVLIQTRGREDIVFKHDSDAVRIGLELTDKFASLQPEQVTYVANNMTTQQRYSPRARLGLPVEYMPQF